MPDWIQYVRKNLLLEDIKRERADEIIEDLARQLEDFYREVMVRQKAILKDSEYQADIYLRKALRILRDKKFRKVITFLDYQNCPRTTNHVERANRYYRKRAKSHYRNRTKRAIWNMIKTDLMHRKENHNIIGFVPQRVLHPLQQPR